MANAIRLFICSNRLLFYHPLVLYKSTLYTGRFQYSEPPSSLYESAVHTIEIFNSLRAEFNKRITV